MILRHASMLIEAKGEYTGIRELRKHFAWYTAGMKKASMMKIIIPCIKGAPAIKLPVDGLRRME